MYPDWLKNIGIYPSWLGTISLVIAIDLCRIRSFSNTATGRNFYNKTMRRIYMNISIPRRYTDYGRRIRRPA
jgi:hypothetical protein